MRLTLIIIIKKGHYIFFVLCLVQRLINSFVEQYVFHIYSIQFIARKRGKICIHNIIIRVRSYIKNRRVSENYVNRLSCKNIQNDIILLYQYNVMMCIFFFTIVVMLLFFLIYVFLCNIYMLF
jgi:hypothetical protein